MTSPAILTAWSDVSKEVIGEIPDVPFVIFLNFKFLIIFAPTVGVTAKKTQLHELTIS